MQIKSELGGRSQRLDLASGRRAVARGELALIPTAYYHYVRHRIFIHLGSVLIVSIGLPTFMSGDVCVYYYLPPTQFQKLVRSTVHSDVCTAELIVSCFDQPLTESASRSRSNKRLYALSGCV